MNLAAAQIRSFAEQGIAHNVEVGITCQSETLGESGPAGFFNIDQKLGRVVDAHARVERHDARCGFLVVGTQAVRAAVERGKGRMRLEDEIRLAGKPEARILEVREHRGHIVGGRRIGRILGGGGICGLRFGRGSLEAAEGLLA